jgi:transcriptional regulator with XRE-family HTH domain
MVLELGDNIRKLRKHAGLRVTDLAGRLGEPSQMVSKWENGHTRVPSDRIPEIADAIGVPIGALFGRESPSAAQLTQVSNQLKSLLAVGQGRVEIRVYPIASSDGSTTATVEVEPDAEERIVDLRQRAIQRRAEKQVGHTTGLDRVPEDPGIQTVEADASFREGLAKQLLAEWKEFSPFEQALVEELAAAADRLRQRLLREEHEVSRGATAGRPTQ